MLWLLQVALAAWAGQTELEELRQRTAAELAAAKAKRAHESNSPQADLDMAIGKLKAIEARTKEDMVDVKKRMAAAGGQGWEKALTPTSFLETDAELERDADRLDRADRDLRGHLAAGVTDNHQADLAAVLAHVHANAAATLKRIRARIGAPSSFLETDAEAEDMKSMAAKIKAVEAETSKHLEELLSKAVPSSLLETEPKKMNEADKSPELQQFDAKLHAIEEATMKKIDHLRYENGGQMSLLETDAKADAKDAKAEDADDYALPTKLPFPHKLHHQRRLPEIKSKLDKIFKPVIQALDKDEHAEAEELIKERRTMTEIGAADKDGNMRPELASALHKQLALAASEAGIPGGIGDDAEPSSFLERGARKRGVPTFEDLDRKIQNLKDYTKEVFDPSSFLQTGAVQPHTHIASASGWQTKLDSIKNDADEIQANAKATMAEAQSTLQLDGVEKPGQGYNSFIEGAPTGFHMSSKRDEKMQRAFLDMNQKIVAATAKLKENLGNMKLLKKDLKPADASSFLQETLPTLDDLRAAARHAATVVQEAVGSGQNLRGPDDY